MQTQDTDQKNGPNEAGFIGYASARIILALLLVTAVIGGTNALLNHLDLAAPISTARSDIEQDQVQGQTPMVVETENHVAEKEHTGADITEGMVDDPQVNDSDLSPAKADTQEVKSIADSTTPPPPPLPTKPPALHNEIATAEANKPLAQAAPHNTEPASQEIHIAPLPQAPQSPSQDAPHQTATPPERHPATRPVAPQPSAHSAEQKQSYRPTGVTFVESVMRPIDYELNQRFLGWRPNDIVNLADNTNNFQLGVLEVTRRTAVQLAERISRTGSTDVFNAHLQNAMNWLMVRADRYWFPAPESKYKESLKELEAYKQNLIDGTASFHTRTDNLIPLLKAYEDLLGSSDENLVKRKEKDGSAVSTFKADNYFYYAQGVASTIAVILEAIQHDFEPILESRNGSGLLHHAVESCRIAADLDPWLITNSDLDGFFANHRANMAAPISHARFYIGQLIKTLST